MNKSKLLWILLVLTAILVITTLAPLEKTLGSKARIVYLHGALVWAAIMFFMAAAIAGLVGLLTNKEIIHNWSHAFGRTALLFWIIFLPMSLYVMQSTWNGLFMDEPRFRMGFNFAVVGVLLQFGLSRFPKPAWTSLANLLFAGALLWSLSGIETVMHPQSPVANSNSREIQFFYLALLVLFLSAGWLISSWLNKRDLANTDK